MLLLTGAVVLAATVHGDWAGSDYALAQVTYGGLCRTPFGTCPTRPAPVGSVCLCGNVRGVVAQR